MNWMISRSKRVLAFALAVIMLAISQMNLFLPVYAAETEDIDLYTLVANEYFGEDETAYNVLTSGALKGNESVSITYPNADSGLISFKEGKIYASDFASGYGELYWIPVSYNCGDYSDDFVENEADFSGEADTVTVNYALSLVSETYDALDLGCELPELPAVLMEEAKLQLSALTDLSSEETMGYMEQLYYKNMITISLALGTKYFGTLPSMSAEGEEVYDETKSSLLYASFAETVNKITTNCYPSGTDINRNLKLYTLLEEYSNEEDGLQYYYKNSATILTELNLLCDYLDEMYAEDVSRGLSEEDKATAIAYILKKAEEMRGVEVEFDALRAGLNTTKQNLKVPNAAIDVESESLGVLTKILAAGGVVTSYAEEATLRTAFEAPVLYTVAFYAGEGNGDMLSRSVAYGTVLDLPTCEFTAPLGKEFDCWQIGETYYQVGETYTVTGDTTVTAVWKMLSYTVTYEANGGTGTMAGASVEYGEELILPECEFAAPEGMKFDCWQIGTETYSAGDAYTVTGDTVAIAVWEKATCVVTYLDGDVVKNSQTVENGFVLQLLPKVLVGMLYTIPEGMEFRCWAVNGVERMPGYQHTVTEDTVVTAVWKPIASEEYSIDTVVVENADGVAVATVPNGEMKVTVSVTNLTSGDDVVENALVILAAYTEEGRLVTTESMAVENLASNGTANVSESLNNSDGKIAALKVFVVKSFEDMAPLGSAIVFPAQDS